MTEKLILEKLEQMEKKVDKIEVAVGLIAVQSERINNLSIQVQGLWGKYDESCRPDGTISTIKNFQAGCPRDSIKETVARQWAAIGLLAAIVTGSILKAFGVV